MDSTVTIWVAFIAGLFSILAPCVLPMVPAYIAYVGGANGHTKNTRYKTTLINSLLFVLGFTIVFVGMGALAGFFGIYIFRDFPWVSQLSGGVLIVFGLYTILTSVGGYQPNWLSKIKTLGDGWARRIHRKQKDNNKFFITFGSVLMGMALAMVWIPCIGGILGAILGLASTSSTATSGSLFLFVYSMGLAVPFVLLALFVKKAHAVIRKFGKTLLVIQLIGGTLLIFFGVLMFTDNISLIYIWKYKMFN